MSKNPANGPTADKFRLDFSTQPFHKSLWNQQAAQVFTEVFISSDGPKGDPPAIKEQFLQRLKRIHKQYIVSLQTSEEVASSAEDESMEPTPRKSRRDSASTKRQRRNQRVLTVRIQVLAQ